MCLKYNFSPDKKLLNWNLSYLNYIQSILLAVQVKIIITTVYTLHTIKCILGVQFDKFEQITAVKI